MTLLVVAFNCCTYRSIAAMMLTTLSCCSLLSPCKAVDGNSLAGEVEGECLYLCSVGFSREAGQAVLGLPLRLSRFKLEPSVHLQH